MLLYPRSSSGSVRLIYLQQPLGLEYAAAVPLEKGQMLQRRGELGQVEVVEPQRLFHLSIVLLRGATYTYTPHHSSGKR